MKTILGITAEYDPFHKGHAYQLARARETVCPDAVICVMSGDFTQRGEPAVLDKWTRAQIAVRQGVDLVLELPFQHACNRAERFACGAVDLLVCTGVTHLCFGCEAEHPQDLVLLASKQMEQAGQIETVTRDLMKDGHSRAKAAEMASRRLFGNELADLMLPPNNILALEYLKRISWWEKTRGITVQSFPIRRFGSGYRSVDPQEGFAGGSAIRRMIEAREDITAYLPYEWEELPWIDQAGARQRLYEHVRGIILRSTPQQLAAIYCVGEGMEHRLLREAKRQDSWEDFLSSMVSRRYTAAAIRRIMIYLLMNVEEMPVCSPYGRILAAGPAGRKLLRKLSDGGAEGERPEGECPQGERTEGIPPVVLLSGNRQTSWAPEPVRRSAELDARATDLFNLICARALDQCSDHRRRPYMPDA